MPEQEVEHVEALAVARNSLEQIERASIDIQIATAHQYPRSMELFRQRAEAMVTLDETTAASCIYRRPVGMKGNQVVYAEGESIRLAEIVAASYGNIRVAGRITEMNPRYVKAQGVAHDLESNMACTAEVVESTVGKSGAPYSERQRLLIAKVAQAKAIRDAIFKVVPKALCKPLADKAKLVAQGDAKTFESRRKAVGDWVKSLKIDAKRVWNAVGIRGVQDIDTNVLLLLHGIKTALEDNDITVDEAFPKPEAEAKDGSVADRVKERFDKKDTKKDNKSEGSKSTGKGKKKAAPKTKKEPEKKTEGAGEQTESEAPPPPPAKIMKCVRCLREEPATEVKDGKCPHCMGTMQEV